MSATSILTERVANDAPDTGSATLLGLGPLVRKDFREWLRSKRAWVTPLVVTPILVLTAANGAINHWAVVNFPAEDGKQITPISLDATQNFMAAIGTQFMVIAAIYATMSLLIAERESGTLAWTASKPVSRLSIWLSKWISSSVVLFVAALLIPVLVTAAVVAALYGPFDPWLLVTSIVGTAALIVWFAAFGLAVGAHVRSHALVVAAGLGVLIVPSIVGGLWAPILDVMPTSIATWVMELSAGQVGSILTPISYLVSIAVIVAIAGRRMRRMEF